MKDHIILCIPGTWRDRTDFIETLSAGTGGKLTVEGDRLRNRATGDTFEFNMFPHVDGMGEDFRESSRLKPISEEILAKVADHSTFVALYADRGDAALALAMSEMALCILECGGLALRVEGAKRAMDRDTWQKGIEQARELGPFMLYHQFVWVFIRGEGCFDSIGMPFLGQPDISVETDDPEVALAVFNEFAKYMLIHRPEISDGQTIAFEGTDGVWQMTKVEHSCADDPDIDFSLGMWRLRRTVPRSKGARMLRNLKDAALTVLSRGRNV